jgi:hypothetical protein
MPRHRKNQGGDRDFPSMGELGRRVLPPQNGFSRPQTAPRHRKKMHGGRDFPSMGGDGQTLFLTSPERLFPSMISLVIVKRSEPSQGGGGVFHSFPLA